ncbi:hypothetical protein GCM10010397_84400 [Streptomyces spinoverrucosus]|nr:hypothetical protein GCM10010397_84400 [Streptomyces spinoverrucosus]
MLGPVGLLDVRGAELDGECEEPLPLTHVNIPVQINPGHGMPAALLVRTVNYNDNTFTHRQRIVKSFLMSDEIALLVADVFEAAGALRRLGEHTAQAEGLTQARWQVLSVVSETALTVPQAARRLGVSRQNVQRVANDLASSGTPPIRPTLTTAAPRC